MNKALYFLVALTVLNSCEDDNETHTKVSGHVFSTGSGKPIEGVKIYMYDGIGHSGGWVDLGDGSKRGSSRIDSTLTDTNGYFQIELDGEEPVLYPFKAGYSFEYIIGGAVIGIMPLKAGSNNNNISIFLDGHAKFNPVLVNKTNFQLEDKITINVYTKWHNPLSLSYLGNGPHIFSWSLPDGITVLGDSYLKYTLEIVKSNKMNTIIDSVYVAQGAVYRDTIWY